MKKKIGQFLPIMLALIAVLILMATGSRDKPAQEGTEPTGSTGATEQTAPSQPKTEPTRAAAASNGPEKVEEVLLNRWLDETALSHCVYDPELNGEGDTAGAGKKAMGFTLAGFSDEQRMNPIAAFWLLVEEGLYAKVPDGSGVMEVPAADLPDRGAKGYANSAEGARELLTDLLAAAGEVYDGLELEEDLLGSGGAVEQSRVFHAPGDCYYAYFVCYGDRSAHFLCVYLRGGDRITDVELQLLNLRYASGDAGDLAQMDQRGDRQAAALMTAAELLMTGESRAAQGKVPFAYELGGFDAAVERFHFTAADEQGSLTNYRLRIKE